MRGNGKRLLMSRCLREKSPGVTKIEDGGALIELVVIFRPKKNYNKY